MWVFCYYCIFGSCFVDRSCCQLNCPVWPWLAGAEGAHDTEQCSVLLLPVSSPEVVPGLETNFQWELGTLFVCGQLALTKLRSSVPAGLPQEEAPISLRKCLLACAVKCTKVCRSYSLGIFLLLLLHTLVQSLCICNAGFR